MGYAKKSMKMEGEVEVEAEAKKWMLTALRSPLKPIHTNKNDEQKECDEVHEQEECDEEKCTTPTSDGSRIPSSRFVKCPGAPRKRKSSSKKYQLMSSKHVGREFFSPPELETLETLFVRTVNHQRSQFA